MEKFSEAENEAALRQLYLQALAQTPVGDGVRIGELRASLRARRALLARAPSADVILTLKPLVPVVIESEPDPLEQSRVDWGKVIVAFIGIAFLLAILFG